MLRGGEYVSIDSRSLVPGDLLVVKDSWLLPCDLLILEGATSLLLFTSPGATALHLITIFCHCTSRPTDVCSALRRHKLSQKGTELLRCCTISEASYSARGLVM